MSEEVVNKDVETPAQKIPKKRALNRSIFYVFILRVYIKF